MLFGREEERARLAALLEAARSGRSAVLVVTGPLGVGKTSLLADLVEQAHGFRVLRARGLETESELPYSGLHQLLRPVLGEVAALPPAHRTALDAAFGLADAARADRFLVSVALLGLLAQVAEREHLLSVVDDAQWIDDASLAALVFVARRLEAEGVAMVLSARDDELAGFDPRGLPVLPIRPLDRNAAEQLVASTTRGTASPAVVRRLVSGAAGNPLGLKELAAALSPEQLSGREPLPDPLPVTKDLERLCFARLRVLAAATQAALLVAAADDSGHLATVLDAMSELGLPRDALDEAERAGVIRVSAGHLEFAHPLVRSSRYHGATSAERRAAHRALAAVLAGEEQADSRAWHLAAASVGPDQRVASELQAAAARARTRGGFGAAARALERAAELTDSPEAAAGLLAAAARDAWMAGDIAWCVALLERLRPEPSDRAVRADLALLRGQVELGRGMPARAFEILDAAADESDRLDPHQRLHILVAAGEAAALGDRDDLLSRLGRRAAALEPASDHERSLAALLAGLGALVDGAYDESAARLEEVARLAEVHADAVHLSWAGAGLVYLGDYDGSIALFRRAATQVRAAGDVATLANVLRFLSSIEAASGELAAALADGAEAVRLARETGLAGVESYALASLASVASFRGLEDECRRYAREATESAASRGIGHASVLAIRALAALDLSAGRYEEAFTKLRQVTAERPGARNPLTAVLMYAETVEAAARTGHRDEASRLVDRLERWARATGRPWPRALLARSRALLLEGAGAEQHYIEALEVQSARWPLPAARTRLLYGEWLRRERRRIDAREQLREALDVFERFGAQGWAERARTELRATGRTARPRDDPSALDRLTPQELQVARFVAQGLSNPEVAAQLFLSRRTIDFHLRNVYAKLGISSRAELMRFPLQPLESLAA